MIRVIFSKSVSDSINGFNWAYAPPYYHGEAWVDIIIHTSNASSPKTTFTIEELQQTASYVYRRVDIGIKESSATYAVTPIAGELIHTGYKRTVVPTAGVGPYGYGVNRNAMHLSASFTLDGLRKSIGQGINSQQWVIRPKFLTPMLNFNHLSSSDSITTSSYGTETIPRGMWHQFGKIPKTNEGITISMEDVPKPWLNSHYDTQDNDTVYNRRSASTFSANKVKSLADVLQFDKNPKKLGRLKEFKEVYEGIVAIPLITSEGSDPTALTYDQEEIKNSLQAFNADENYSDNIIESLSFLRKFVLPREFDALNAPLRPTNDPRFPGGQPILGDGDAKLYKFFFFEFSAKLSRNDLSYIWQNLLPRDFEEGIDGKVIYTPDFQSRTRRLVEQTNVKLSDKLEVTDPRMISAIKTDRVRWHIFKVKQRGVFSYSQDRERSLQLDRVREENVDFNQVTNSFQRFKIKTDSLTFEPNPVVGFNWPYDYFSLTEKIKINAKVKFKGNN